MRPLYMAALAVPFLLTLHATASRALTPDEVRAAAATAAQVVQESKAPAEHTVVPKTPPHPHYWTLVMRTPGQPLSFAGNFLQADACERSRALVGRQLHRLGWGRAVCLELVQP